MHQVIARLRVKQEHRSVFEDALAVLLPKTHDESGCLFFEAYREPKTEGVYWLAERWRDRDALEAHYAQPYVRAMFDHYDDWLLSPPEIFEVEPFTLQ